MNMGLEFWKTTGYSFTNSFKSAQRSRIWTRIWSTGLEDFFGGRRMLFSEHQHSGKTKEILESYDSTWNAAPLGLLALFDWQGLLSVLPWESFWGLVWTSWERMPWLVSYVCKGQIEESNKTHAMFPHPCSTPIKLKIRSAVRLGLYKIRIWKSDKHLK